MQVRRPIFLLALGSWLLCLAFSFPAGGMVLPLFCILLSLFPMKLWLVLLCFLPVVICPNVCAGEYSGAFSIVDHGVVQMDKVIATEENSYRYFGKLPQGEYWGTFEIRPFPQKNGRWFINRSYAARGIFAEAKVMKAEFEADIPLTLRQRLLSSFHRRMEGMGEHRGMAFSLLFGIREGLDREMEKGLQELGMLHLFVLSGLHLGIYYRGVIRLGNALSLPRMAVEIIAFSLLLFFCYLSSWHVSALRTLLLALVRSIGFYLKRKPDQSESLGLVCLILLWINPAWAGSLSFLLGTIAYAGLRLSRKYKLFWMNIALLPMQILFVERLSIVYLIVNAIVSALSAPLLSLIAVAFIWTSLQPLASFLLAGLVRALYLTRQVVLFSVQMPSPACLSLVVIYLLWIFRLLLREKEPAWTWGKNKAAWFLAAGLILSSMTLVFDKKMQRGVIFFDVGQGDASLIVTQSGRSILIDTGRDKTLIRKLKTLGIEQVDMLILSHLDADHSALAEEIPCRELYVPVGESMGIPLRKGDFLSIDDVDIFVHHPQRAGSDRNDDSLVLLVECYGKRVLYTGDVGAAVLGSLDLGYVDVLKFPHHGARSSLHEGALDTMQPLMTILSVGRNNYHHPSPLVIEALEKRGLRYHSTWMSGNFFFNETGFRSY